MSRGVHTYPSDAGISAYPGCTGPHLESLTTGHQIMVCGTVYYIIVLFFLLADEQEPGLTDAHEAADCSLLFTDKRAIIDAPQKA